MQTFTEFYKQNKNELDAVFFDIDGTLINGQEALPGAVELLNLLQKEECPWFLLTNDSCHSQAEKSRFMQRAGLPVDETNIISSGNVLKWWAEHYYNGGLFYRFGSLGEPDYAISAGIEVTRESALAQECCGVIMGEGCFDWRQNLETVFNIFLKHPEYPLIAVNPDSYGATADGSKMSISSGGFTRLICSLLNDAGVHIEPIYLGKPYAPFYQCACSHIREQFPALEYLDPKRIMMVGDSLRSDICGGNRAGFTTCLVLSGITNLETARKAENEQKPDLIFQAV